MYYKLTHIGLSSIRLFEIVYYILKMNKIIYYSITIDMFKCIEVLKNSTTYIQWCNQGDWRVVVHIQIILST